MEVSFSRRVAGHVGVAAHRDMLCEHGRGEAGFFFGLLAAGLTGRRNGAARFVELGLGLRSYFYALGIYII